MTLSRDDLHRRSWLEPEAAGSEANHSSGGRHAFTGRQGEHACAAESSGENETAGRNDGIHI